MQFIDLHKQYKVIEKEVRQGMEKVLNHKRFIMGEEVTAFERELAQYTGVKHAITCASGTDALVLPLMAMELDENDAVFVPSFTFFATAESVTLAGGTPVFVDSDPDTFNMSPESLKDAIKNVMAEGKLKPKAVIPVDLFGLPADFDALCKIATNHGLMVLEDGAQGFGGEYKGNRACSFGHIAATSFFPAKPLGCYGDGGAIFTNDDEIAEILKSIHVHGQGKDKYDNVRIGLNSRLDTMQAVVLREKLKIFPGELDARDKLAALYQSLLKDVAKTPVVPLGYRCSWAQYTLQAENHQLREKVLKDLKEKEVPVMVYYPIPIHKSTAYADKYQSYTSLKNCETLAKTVFSLPMHPYLTEKEIQEVAKAVKDILK